MYYFPQIVTTLVLNEYQTDADLEWRIKGILENNAQLQ
jgi:hypothetical protein